jgi:hypothetical protein
MDFVNTCRGADIEWKQTMRAIAKSKNSPEQDCGGKMGNGIFELRIAGRSGIFELRMAGGFCDGVANPAT